MKPRQKNKTQKALSRARFFFWEGQFLLGEARVRREAKKIATKALRRLNKLILREEKEEDC